MRHWWYFLRRCLNSSEFVSLHRRISMKSGMFLYLGRKRHSRFFMVWMYKFLTRRSRIFCCTSLFVAIFWLGVSPSTIDDSLGRPRSLKVLRLRAEIRILMLRYFLAFGSFDVDFLRLLILATPQNLLLTSHLANIHPHEAQNQIKFFQRFLSKLMYSWLVCWGNWHAVTNVPKGKWWSVNVKPYLFPMLSCHRPFYRARCSSIPPFFW